jgi:hypothetical protein
MIDGQTCKHTYPRKWCSRCQTAEVDIELPLPPKWDDHDCDEECVDETCEQCRSVPPES